jgi:hypothetical protein
MNNGILNCIPGHPYVRRFVYETLKPLETLQKNQKGLEKHLALAGNKF